MALGTREKAAKFAAGHEEKFLVEGASVECLGVEPGKPQRFRAVAYTGKQVSRWFGQMIVKSSGLKRDEHMAMLLEHNDSKPVSVCDDHEVDENGKVTLEGYFLSAQASEDSPRVQALIKEGFPFKQSIGVRFLKHHELDDDGEEEVNGRLVKGPALIVDEAQLFETSWIHCSPADWDTSAEMMRLKAQERPMADKDENKLALAAALPAADAERLVAEGVSAGVKAALNERRSQFKAILSALPGPENKKLRIQVKTGKLSLEKAKDVRSEKDRTKLAKLEKLQAERDAAQAEIAKKFKHTGLGYVPPEDRGGRPESGKFDGLKFEDRVSAELAAQPALGRMLNAGLDRSDLVKFGADRTLLAWLKAEGAKTTRDPINPVPRLCDAFGKGGHVSPNTLASIKAMVEDVLTGIESNETQRLDVGSSAPDLSKITVNGFQGQFYTSYEEQLGKNWSADHSFQIPSDQQQEVVRWLSAPPMLQEWSGPRIAKSIAIYQQLLQAVKFEATLPVDRFDWDHQKWGLISKSFGLFGAVASNQWDIRFTQLMEANPTAYDTHPLFSNAHTLGGSGGTIVNDYSSSGTAGTKGVASTLAVADPTNVLQLEWANIILQLYPMFFGWQWANGMFMNATADQWDIMVHPKYMGNLQGALSSERLDNGASNPIFGQRANFRALKNPYITLPQYGYIIRRDTTNKPFLKAEPDPLEMLWQGPGSHVAFNEDKYLMGLRAVRSIAPGAFESILRFQIGAS